MSLPSKQKGPGGSANSHQDQNTQMGDYDSPKGNRKTGPRHVPGQLPIVQAATIYPPALGLVTAIIVPDDVCPACGDWHNHKAKWPVGALVNKRARCGVRYELALHRPKVKRGRRAA